MTDKYILGIDCETSGVSKTDKICQIAAIEFMQRDLSFIATGLQFNHYYNPTIPCTDEAANVHKLTKEFLDKQTVIRENCLSLNALWGCMLAADVIVAHHAKFDLDFLKRELLIEVGSSEINKKWDYIERKTYCTYKRAKQLKVPVEKYSLNNLLQYFDIDIGNRLNSHNAVDDATLAGYLYANLELLSIDI
jgi:DNA polymerase III epsilon subunit-like protein